MRSCSTVNIPLAIKIKPQMVVEYQLNKKRKEQELAKIQAEQAEEKQEESLASEDPEGSPQEPDS